MYQYDIYTCVAADALSQILKNVCVTFPHIVNIQHSWMPGLDVRKGIPTMHAQDQKRGKCT